MRRRARVAEFTLVHQERLLERSLAALRQAEIDVLLLKGSGLAAGLFRSFTNRPMGDIDLLVHHDEALSARDVLLGAGWVWPHDPALDRFYAGHQHLPPLYDKMRAGPSLELHTELLMTGNPFHIPAETLWAARRPVKVGAQESAAPHPHHQLLHVCIHFAWANFLESSAWNALRDTHALAASGQIQWDAFVETVRAARAETCVYWTLYLARELTDAAIPADAMSALRPRMSSWRRTALERNAVATCIGAGVRCPSTRARRHLWEATIQPERSGHGAARPWDRDAEFTPSDGYAPGGAWRERQNARVSNWSRYLRLLVGGSA